MDENAKIEKHREKLKAAKQERAAKSDEVGGRPKHVRPEKYGPKRSSSEESGRAKPEKQKRPRSAPGMSKPVEMTSGDKGVKPMDRRREKKRPRPSSELPGRRGPSAEKEPKKQRTVSPVSRSAAGDKVGAKKPIKPIEEVLGDDQSKKLEVESKNISNDQDRAITPTKRPERPARMAPTEAKSPDRVDNIASLSPSQVRDRGRGRAADKRDKGSVKGSAKTPKNLESEEKRKDLKPEQIKPKQKDGVAPPKEVRGRGRGREAAASKERPGEFRKDGKPGIDKKDKVEKPAALEKEPGLRTGSPVADTIPDAKTGVDYKDRARVTSEDAGSPLTTEQIRGRGRGKAGVPSKERPGIAQSNEASMIPDTKGKLGSDARTEKDKLEPTADRVSPLRTEQVRGRGRGRTKVPSQERPGDAKSNEAATIPGTKEKLEPDAKTERDKPEPTAARAPSKERMGIASVEKPADARVKRDKEPAAVKAPDSPSQVRGRGRGRADVGRKELSSGKAVQDTTVVKPEPDKSKSRPHTTPTAVIPDSVEENKKGSISPLQTKQARERGRSRASVGSKERPGEHEKDQKPKVGEKESKESAAGLKNLAKLKEPDKNQKKAGPVKEGPISPSQTKQVRGREKSRAGVGSKERPSKPEKDPKSGVSEKEPKASAAGLKGIAKLEKPNKNQKETGPVKEDPVSPSQIEQDRVDVGSKERPGELEKDQKAEIGEKQPKTSPAGARKPTKVDKDPREASPEKKGLVSPSQVDQVKGRGRGRGRASVSKDRPEKPEKGQKGEIDEGEPKGRPAVGREPKTEEYDKGQKETGLLKEGPISPSQPAQVRGRAGVGSKERPGQPEKDQKAEIGEKKHKANATGVKIPAKVQELDKDQKEAGPVKEGLVSSSQIEQIRGRGRGRGRAAIGSKERLGPEQDQRKVDVKDPEKVEEPDKDRKEDSSVKESLVSPSQIEQVRGRGRGRGKAGIRSKERPGGPEQDQEKVDVKDPEKVEEPDKDRKEDSSVKEGLVSPSQIEQLRGREKGRGKTGVGSKERPGELEEDEKKVRIKDPARVEEPGKGRKEDGLLKEGLVSPSQIEQVRERGRGRGKTGIGSKERPGEPEEDQKKAGVKDPARVEEPDKGRKEDGSVKEGFVSPSQIEQVRGRGRGRGKAGIGSKERPGKLEQDQRKAGVKDTAKVEEPDKGQTEDGSEKEGLVSLSQIEQAWGRGRERGKAGIGSKERPGEPEQDQRKAGLKDPSKVEEPDKGRTEDGSEKESLVSLSQIEQARGRGRGRGKAGIGSKERPGEPEQDQRKAGLKDPSKVKEPDKGLVSPSQIEQVRGRGRGRGKAGIGSKEGPGELEEDQKKAGVKDTAKVEKPDKGRTEDGSVKEGPVSPLQTEQVRGRGRGRTGVGINERPGKAETAQKEEIGDKEPKINLAEVKRPAEVEKPDRGQKAASPVTDEFDSPLSTGQIQGRGRGKEGVLLTERPGVVKPDKSATIPDKKETLEPTAGTEDLKPKPAADSRLSSLTERPGVAKPDESAAIPHRKEKLEPGTRTEEGKPKPAAATDQIRGRGKGKTGVPFTEKPEVTKPHESPTILDKTETLEPAAKTEEVKPKPAAEFGSPSATDQIRGRGKGKTGVPFTEKPEVTKPHKYPTILDKTETLEPAAKTEEVKPKPAAEGKSRLSPLTQGPGITKSNESAAIPHKKEKLEPGARTEEGKPKPASATDQITGRGRGKAGVPLTDRPEVIKPQESATIPDKKETLEPPTGTEEVEPKPAAEYDSRLTPLTERPGVAKPDKSAAILQKKEEIEPGARTEEGKPKPAADLGSPLTTDQIHDRGRGKAGVPLAERPGAAKLNESAAIPDKYDKLEPDTRTKEDKPKAAADFDSPITTDQIRGRGRGKAGVPLTERPGVAKPNESATILDKKDKVQPDTRTEDVKSKAAPDLDSPLTTDKISGRGKDKEEVFLTERPGVVKHHESATISDKADKLEPSARTEKDKPNAAADLSSPLTTDQIRGRGRGKAGVPLTERPGIAKPNESTTIPDKKDEVEPDTRTEDAKPKADLGSPLTASQIRGRGRSKTEVQLAKEPGVAKPYEFATVLDKQDKLEPDAKTEEDKPEAAAADQMRGRERAKAGVPPMERPGVAKPPESATVLGKEDKSEPDAKIEEGTPKAAAGEIVHPSIKKQDSLSDRSEEVTSATIDNDIERKSGTSEEFIDALDLDAERITGISREYLDVHIQDDDEDHEHKRRRSYKEKARDKVKSDILGPTSKHLAEIKKEVLDKIKHPKRKKDVEVILSDKELSDTEKDKDQEKTKEKLKGKEKEIPQKDELDADREILFKPKVLEKEHDLYRKRSSETPSDHWPKNISIEAILPPKKEFRKATEFIPMKKEDVERRPIILEDEEAQGSIATSGETQLTEASRADVPTIGHPVISAIPTAVEERVDQKDPRYEMLGATEIGGPEKDIRRDERIREEMKQGYEDKGQDLTDTSEKVYSALDTFPSQATEEDYISIPSSLSQEEGIFSKDEVTEMKRADHKCFASCRNAKGRSTLFGEETGGIVMGTDTETPHDLVPPGYYLPDDATPRQLMPEWTNLPEATPIEKDDLSLSEITEPTGSESDRAIWIVPTSEDQILKAPKDKSIPRLEQEWETDTETFPDEYQDQMAISDDIMRDAMPRVLSGQVVRLPLASPLMDRTTPQTLSEAIYQQKLSSKSCRGPCAIKKMEIKAFEEEVVATVEDVSDIHTDSDMPDEFYDSMEATDNAKLDVPEGTEKLNEKFEDAMEYPPQSISSGICRAKCSNKNNADNKIKQTIKSTDELNDDLENAEHFKSLPEVVDDSNSIEEHNKSKTFRYRLPTALDETQSNSSSEQQIPKTESKFEDASSISNIESLTTATISHLESSAMPSISNIEPIIYTISSMESVAILSDFGKITETEQESLPVEKNDKNILEQKFPERDVFTDPSIQVVAPRRLRDIEERSHPRIKEEYVNASQSKITKVQETDLTQAINKKPAKNGNIQDRILEKEVAHDTVVQVPPRDFPPPSDISIILTDFEDKSDQEIEEEFADALLASDIVEPLEQTVGEEYKTTPHKQQFKALSVLEIPTSTTDAVCKLASISVETIQKKHSSKYVEAIEKMPLPKQEKAIPRFASWFSSAGATTKEKRVCSAPCSRAINPKDTIEKADKSIDFRPKTGILATSTKPEYRATQHSMSTTTVKSAEQLEMCLKRLTAPPKRICRAKCALMPKNKDEEIERLKYELAAKDAYCAEQRKIATSALEQLENIKNIVEERDDLRKKLQTSQYELADLKKNLETMGFGDAKSIDKTKSDVYVPFNKASNSSMTNSLDNEIKLLEEDIEKMRTSNLSPEGEAKVIKKEVEVLKRYCAKLSSIQEENASLKKYNMELQQRCLESEDKLQAIGCGDKSTFDNLQDRLLTLNETIAERDVLRNRVEQLEQELNVYHDLPEDVEVFKRRSILLDDVLKDRDRLAKRVEQMRGIDDDILPLKLKAERVDELERQLRLATKDIQTAEDELDSMRNKCTMAEIEVLNQKSEADTLRSKIICMEHEMESLKSMCKEQEIMQIEKERLQATLDELMRMQNDYEHTCIQLKALDIVKAEKDRYKRKYEDLVGLESECHMLREQLDKAKTIERKKEALERQAEDLEKCICEQEDEIRRLVCHIDCLAKGKEDQQYRMKEVVSNLKIELEEKESMLQLSEEKMTTMKDKIDSSFHDISEETKNLRLKHKYLEKEITVLKSINLDLQHKLNETTAENTSIVEELENKNHIIETMQEVLKDRETCQEGSQAVYNPTEITRLQTELEYAKYENQQLQELAAEAGNENDETNRQLRDMLDQSRTAIERIALELARQYTDWDCKKRYRCCPACTCKQKNRGAEPVVIYKCCANCTCKMKSKKRTLSADSSPRSYRCSAKQIQPLVDSACQCESQRNNELKSKKTILSADSSPRGCTCGARQVQHLMDSACQCDFRRDAESSLREDSPRCCYSCNCKCKSLKANTGELEDELDEDQMYTARSVDESRARLTELESELRNANDTIVKLIETIATNERLAEENSALKKHSTEVQEVAKDQIEDLVEHLKNAKGKVVELEAKNYHLNLDLCRCQKYLEEPGVEEETADTEKYLQQLGVQKEISYTPEQMRDLEESLKENENALNQMDVLKQQLFANKAQDQLEIHNLEEEVKNYLIEKEALLKIIDRLKDQLEPTENLPDMTSSENLKAKLEELKGELNKARNKIGETQARNCKLKFHLFECKKRLRESDVKSEILATESDTEEKPYINATTKLKADLEECLREKQNLLKQIHDLKQQLSSGDDILNDLRAELEKCLKEKEAISRLIETLQNQLASGATEDLPDMAVFAKLKADLDNCLSEKEILLKQISDLKRQPASGSDIMNLLKTDLEKCLKEKETLSKIIEHLQNQLASGTTEDLPDMAAFAKLKADLDNCLSEKEILLKQINDLKRQPASGNDIMNLLKTDLEKCLKEKETLSKIIENLQNQLASGTTEDLPDMAAFAKLKADLDNCLSEKEILLKQINDLKRQLASGSDSIDLLKADLEKCLKEKGGLSKMIESLQNQLASGATENLPGMEAFAKLKADLDCCLEEKRHLLKQIDSFKQQIASSPITDQAALAFTQTTEASALASSESSEFTKLRSDLEKCLKEKEALKATIDSLQKQLSSGTPDMATFAKLRADLDTCLYEKANLLKEINNLKAQLASSKTVGQADSIKLATELEDNLKEKQNLLKIIEELREQLAKDKTQDLPDLGAFTILKSQLEDCLKEKEYLLKTIDELKKLAKSTTKDMPDVAAIETLKSQLEGCLKEKESLIRKIDELQKVVKDTQDLPNLTDFIQLRSQLEACLKEKESLLKAIEEFKKPPKIPTQDTTDLAKLKLQLDECLKEKDYLLKTITALKDDNQNLSKEKDDLNKMLTSNVVVTSKRSSKLENELDTISNKNTKLSTENEKLSQLTKDLEKKNEKLSEQISTLKSENDRLKTEFAKLRETQIKLQGENDNLKKSAFDLAILDALKKENDNLKKQLETKQKKVQELQNKLDRSLAAPAIDKSQVDEDRDAMKAIINDLENQLKNLTAKDRIKALEPSDNLKKKLEELTKQLEDTQRRAEAAENVVRNLKASDPTAMLNAEIQKLKDILAQLEKDNASLKDAFAQANNDKAALKRDFDNLLVDAKTTKAQYDALQKTANDLKSEKEGLSKDLQKSNYDDSTLQAENEKLKKRIMELEGDVAKLKKGLDHASTETKKSTDKLNQLMDDNGDLRKKIVQLEGENSKLKKDVEAALSDSKRAADKLVELERENAKCKQTVRDLENEVARLKKELDNMLNDGRKNANVISELQKEIGDLKRKIAQLESVNTKLDDENSKVKKELEQTRGGSQAVTALQDEKNKLKGQNAALQSEADKLRKELENALANASSKLSAATQLQDELADLKKRRQQLEAENDDLKKKLASALADIKKADLQDAHDKLRLKLADIENENSKLRKDLQKAVDDGKKLGDEINELKQRENKCKDKITQLEAENGNLKNSLNSALDDLKKMGSNVAVMQGDESKLRQKVIMLEGENNKLKKDLEAALENARKAIADGSALKDENSKLKQRIAQLESENAKLKSDIDSTANKLKEANNQVKLLEDENNKNKRRMITFEDEAGKLKQKLDAALKEAKRTPAPDDAAKQRLGDELDKLKEELNGAKNEARDSGKELVQLKEENNRFKQKISQLVAENARLKKDLENSLNGAKIAEAELSRLQDNETKLKDKIAQLNNDINKLQKEKATLADSMTKANSDLARLSTLKDNENKLKQKVAQLESENVKLKMDLDTALRDAQRLADEASNVKSENAKMKQELAKHEGENKKLKKDLDHANADAKKGAAGVSDLKEAEDRLKERMAQLEAENAMLKSELDDALNGAKKTATELSKVRDDDGKLKQKLAQLEIENSKLKKDVEQALGDGKGNASQVSELRKENDKLRQKVAQLELEVANLRKDLDGAFNDAKNKTTGMSKLQDEINNLKQKNSQLEKENDKLKKGAETIMKDQKTESDNEKKIRNENNKQKQKISQLEDDLASLKKELESARNAPPPIVKAPDDDRKATIIEQLGIENAKLKKDLENSLKDWQKLTDILKNENESLKQQMSKLQTQIDKLKRDLDTAISQSKKTASDLSKSKENESKLKQRIAQLETENLKLKNDLDDRKDRPNDDNALKNENKKLMDQLKHLKDETDKLKAEGAAAEKAKEHPDESKGLKDEIAKLKQRIAKLETQNTKLAQQYDEAQNNLKASKDQLNSTLQKLEVAEKVGVKPPEDYENQIKQLEAALTKQKKDCDETIKSLKTQFDRDIKNLLRKNEENIEKLQKEHAAIIKDLNDTHDKENKSLRDAINELQAELEPAIKENERLKRSVEDQQRRSIEIKDKVAEVEKVIFKERKRSKDLERKHSELQTKTSEIKENIMMEQKKSLEMEKERDVLRESLLKLVEDRRIIEKENGSLKSQNEELEQEKAQLKSESDKLKRESIAIQEVVKMEKRKSSALMSDLKSISDKMKPIAEEHEDAKKISKEETAERPKIPKLKDDKLTMATFETFSLGPDVIAITVPLSDKEIKFYGNKPCLCGNNLDDILKKATTYGLQGLTIDELQFIHKHLSEAAANILERMGQKTGVLQPTEAGDRLSLLRRIAELEGDLMRKQRQTQQKIAEMQNAVKLEKDRLTKLRKKLEMEKKSDTSREVPRRRISRDVEALEAAKSQLEQRLNEELSNKTKLKKQLSTRKQVYYKETPVRDISNPRCSNSCQ